MFFYITLFTKHVHCYVPFIQELSDDLDQFGLLERIKENPSAFRSLFCPGNDFEWTLDDSDSMLVPKFSPERSSAKQKEIDCFKALSDCLREIYYQQGNLF